MLKDKVKQLPNKPGVYKFLSKSGEVLYVGKAKSLRSRVGQYFNHSDKRAQLPFLLSEAQNLDYIVTTSELESLFLENTLIKEYLPKYNLMLRDDKNFAFIKIDYSTQIPQIGYARKVTNEKTAKYFGPYSSAKKIRHTLDLVRKIFPYCANEKIGHRPCFYYFLHRCNGVCIGEISLTDYQLQLNRIAEFLTGKTESIKKELSSKMRAASHKKQFEAAARLRDQYQALLLLDEKQLSVLTKKVSWDIISVSTNDLSAGVNLFKVREGKLKDNEQFIYDNILIYNKDNERAENVLQSFLETYYSQATDLPQSIITQLKPINPIIIDKLLRSRTKHKVNLITPSKGEKLKLIKLGQVNAEEHLIKWQHNQASNIDNLQLALNELKLRLKLPTTPRRIEGYDISNTQGTNPVGSMVVVKDGLPVKSEYRKFKITDKNTPDDFAMMREMLTRRLKRSLIENKTERWPLPDLIVIDGGKGQLTTAVNVLNELQLKIPVIGLAKRIEEVFLPQRKIPLLLSYDNPALQMLQRLRDEAHRFAITFHKSLRAKQAVKSALDKIPGIGPKTKKLLKQKVGTVAQIKQTSLEELANIVGQPKAKLIKKHL